MCLLYHLYSYYYIKIHIILTNISSSSIGRTPGMRHLLKNSLRLTYSLVNIVNINRYKF